MASKKVDTSNFPPDAAALYQRLHEDPAAALQENTASGKKEALIWLLNNVPEFRPGGAGKAAILGWMKEGTGLWVLEGSEENHRAFDQVFEENPNIEQTEAVKKAGGVYYEHCKLCSCPVREIRTSLLTVADKDYNSNLEKPE